jgi:5-methylcytosine-specific restriction endonuclease McrA
LLAQHGHRCLCCGASEALTADHVIPVSKGGSSNIENIQPLCLPCNTRKGARIIDYRKGPDDKQTSQQLCASCAIPTEG